ncbi:proton-translocating NADH-quinone oxidoreductase, chain N [Lysobacter silvestris]|uniref:NADH-quinone oxidoreductase subunit N n=2 Tax=Solilutibacter silvestris TaxID=1645665 RepID=A0A2K1PZ18_9GAMM|nr:NADH-quinone oxidoreductase subunit NuoN [Lysobacter silvestris]PNS08031.1 proton-translocating NADH-quinone oxidoreductase, chain N [Lysobacter silvestris]
MMGTLSTFNPAELWPLLPELVMVTGTFALLVLDLFVSPRRNGIVHALGFVLLLAVAALCVAGCGGHGTVLNGMFVRDTLADLMKGGILLASALAFVYAWPFLRERGLYKGEITLLMLFATLGMMLLVSAGSLVMVYLGLEMLALSSYALVVTDRDSPVASEAGMKYFVLGALASGMLLFGMSLIYGATGTLDLAQINASAQGGGAHCDLLLAGTVFVVAGIAFKFGAAPFHMWLPDVYQGAATPITLFIGSAPKIAALGMALRLLDGGLSPVSDRWHVMVAALSALSLIVGNFAALMQTNLRRMLAYSTVSHVGFLLMGVAGGGAEGNAAALFYALIYAVTSAAAFGLITLMARKGFEADEIDDYKGLASRQPLMAALILGVMASLAGVPPFIGFFAKLTVIEGALNGGLLWLAIVGIICAVVGAFYYLRVIKVMYFDQPVEGAHPMLAHDEGGVKWLFMVNAGLLLVLSIFLQPLMAWCRSAFGA